MNSVAKTLFIVFSVMALVFCLFVLALAMGMSNIDVEASEETEATDNLPSRFVKISEEEVPNLIGAAGYVVYDKETKIEYFMSAGPRNIGSLTMLYNPSGFPLIYEGE